MPPITSHVWRPPMNKAGGLGGPLAERLCQFMNCRLPREQHERAITLRPKPRQVWS
jgi:hypothetical protein